MPPMTTHDASGCVFYTLLSNLSCGSHNLLFFCYKPTPYSLGFDLCSFAPLGDINEEEEEDADGEQQTHQAVQGPSREEVDAAVKMVRQH